MIKAGTEIRDGDGKLIATVVRDIHIGESLMATSFRLPDGNHPIGGTLIPTAVDEYLKRQIG